MSGSATGILRAEVARIVHTEILKAFGGSHVDMARLERRVEELEKGLGAQLVEALDPEFAARIIAVRAADTARLNQEGKHHD